MTTTQYVEAALRTESIQGGTIRASEMRLLHAGLGLATEAGEFLDQLKKQLFYGKPLDTTNLVEELGDHMWYIAIACDQLGVSLEQVMQINIDKLKARYPVKFTKEAALERNLPVERVVLEAGV